MSKSNTARRRRRRGPLPVLDADLAAALDSRKGQATLHELELAELRARLEADLDPQDASGILARVAGLVSRARERAHGDSTLALGLDLLARVAAEMRLELPPFSEPRHEGTPLVASDTDDRRERMQRALAEFEPDHVLLRADRAFREAARIGNRQLVADLKDRPIDKVPTLLEESEADAMAVACVRALLPEVRGAAAADILTVVRLYRAPRARRGRQRKGATVGKAEERMGALVRLLGLIDRYGKPMQGRDAANYLTELRKERAERLNESAR